MTDPTGEMMSDKNSNIGGNEEAKDGPIKLTEGTASQKSQAREWGEAIVIAVVLAAIIRVFVVEPYKIPSGSMLDTLLIGDHLLVTKFIYGTHIPFTDKVVLPLKEPERGDIIVFKYPENEKLDYIKRVIGTPGDTVEVRDKVVYIDGIPLDEDYTKFTDKDIRPPFISPRDNFGPVTVPDGKLFVMGDNRDNSSDSRFWGFVEIKKIKGKALILYWSWDRDHGGGYGVRWNRIFNRVK